MQIAEMVVASCGDLTGGEIDLSAPPKVVVTSNREMAYLMSVIQRFNKPYDGAGYNFLYYLSISEFQTETGTTTYSGDISGRHLADGLTRNLGILMSFDDPGTPTRMQCTAITSAWIKIPQEEEDPAKIAKILENLQISHPVNLGRLTVAIHEVEAERIKGGFAPTFRFTAYLRELSMPGALEVKATGFVSADCGVILMFPLP